MHRRPRPLLDRHLHPLYHQGYSIQDILSIQRALLVAVRRGYTDIVTLLLDRGVQINFYRGFQGPPPEYTRTRPRTRELNPPPLFLAVQSGHLEVVKLLLERGADANLYAPLPLYRAVEDNRRDIITLLLKYGVGSQTAALKLAVLRGDESMVRFLLDNGFRVQKYGCSAMYAAKIKGDRDMVDLLESRGATLGLLGESDRESWDEEDGDGNWRPGRVRTMFVHWCDEVVEESDAEEDD